MSKTTKIFKNGSSKTLTYLNVRHQFAAQNTECTYRVNLKSAMFRLKPQIGLLRLLSSEL